VLEEIVLKHFSQTPANGNHDHATTSAGHDGVDSRIMIFTSFRDSVNEICSMLKRHAPLVRAMPFVGQSGEGKKKGLTQKEQTEVCRVTFSLWSVISADR
jgi:ERCC4-related helicase